MHHRKKKKKDKSQESGNLTNFSYIYLNYSVCQFHHCRFLKHGDHSFFKIRDFSHTFSDFRTIKFPKTDIA